MKSNSLYSHIYWVNALLLLFNKITALYALLSTLKVPKRHKLTKKKNN